MKVSSTENGIIFGNIGEYQSIVCYYSCLPFTQKSGYVGQNVNGKTNYLLTESEVFTGKSRTETLPY